MPIPSGGLIHKYDLLDPACYVHPGPINDLVGTLDLSTNGFPTYDATFGALTWNGLGIGAYSNAGQYANITTTFTFSLWFKLNDGSVTQCVVNNGERTSAWSGYSLFKDAANSLLDFGANFVWGGYHGSPNIDPTKWYNATYTFSGGTLNFYLNGVLVGTSTGLGSPNAYGPNAYLAWGGNATAGFGAPQFQNKTSYGVVLYYNTALTGPEVLDIYDTYVNRFVPPTNNWLSNNSSYPGSGTTVFDAGSYNQNLTVNLTGTTYDPTNYSFTFDDTANAQLYSQTYGGGFTDLINYRTALTWHFWFENLELTTVPNAYICWMGTRAAGDFYGFGFAKNASDQLSMDVAFGVSVATTANIQSGWHLASIAWSSASGTFDIYIDGVIDISNYSGNLFAAGGIVSTDAIYFGHSPLSGYGESFDGRIGQSTLYPTKQNAGQVLAFYNDTVTRFNPTPPPPYAGNVGGRTFGQGFAG